MPSIGRGRHRQFEGRDVSAGRNNGWCQTLRGVPLGARRHGCRRSSRTSGPKPPTRSGHITVLTMAVIGGAFPNGCGSASVAQTNGATSHSHPGQPVELTFTGALTAHWSQSPTVSPYNCTNGALRLQPGQARPWVFDVDGRISGSDASLSVTLNGYHGPGTYQIPPRSATPNPAFAGHDPEGFITVANDLWDTHSGQGGNVVVDVGEKAGSLDLDLNNSSGSSDVHVQGFWACAASNPATPPTSNVAQAPTLFRAALQAFSGCSQRAVGNQMGAASPETIVALVGCRISFQKAVVEINFPSNTAADVGELNMALDAVTISSQVLSDALDRVRQAITRVAADLGVSAR